jgi:Chaperone of endosialidase
MIQLHTRKVVPPALGATVLAFFLATGVHAQNVGIGFSNPLSKLTVNGNFAVGTNYNVAAPTNGALIEGITGIGTTTPDSANSFLTVASTGQSNITLLPAPASKAPDIRSGIFFGSTYFECTDTPSNGTKDLTFFNIPTQTNVLTLSATNEVGIGTTTPVAPLDVATSADFNFKTSSNVTYFNYNNNNTTGFSVIVDSPGLQAASAVFASNVWSGSSFASFNGTITASDARLKNVIGRSDSAKDLETLEKIEVTDYTMKDVVKFGTKRFKKVVAQQVEKVYPAAVSSNGVKGFTFTPDIYALSDSIKIAKPGVYAISLAKAPDLNDGDTVRLITSKNMELSVVAHSVKGKTFTVETSEALGEKVFVYGKQCLDLKAVDYDAISMLNVSATQELAKKVELLEQQNSNLQDQNKRLTAVEEKEKQEMATVVEQGAQIAALKAENEKLSSMTSRIALLEKALAAMQEKDGSRVQMAALKQ